MIDLKRIPWASFGRRETYAEFQQKCDEQRERVVCFDYRPHFSFVVNATSIQEARDLEWTLAALEQQTYPHWNAYVWVAPEMKREIAAPDNRIALFSSSNLEFGEVLRKASFVPTSEWMMVMRGGDILSPAALYRFVWEMNHFPGPELLYPQEAVVDLSARSPRLSLLNKCRDSFPTLLHFNYIGRCFAFHSNLWRRVEQASEGQAFHTEYSWLLKARSLSGEFGLVPGYWHYRQAKFAEPLFEMDPTASESILREVPFQADVERGTEKASRGTRVLPRISHPESQKISVITCFRDRPEMTLQCVQQVLRCKGDIPIEILLVDNGSSLESRDVISNGLRQMTDRESVKLLSFPEAFNFGRMNNWAVTHHAQGNLLLFLNNDVALDSSVSLDNWAAWALRPEIGSVGICLRFPDGSVQHCGIRASFGDRSHLARIGNSHKQDALTEMGHEVFANTFAANMVRKEVFLGEGGLRSSDMANGFGDVAFCLSLKRKGLKNFYLGYYTGKHIEGASRGRSYEYWEEAGLEREFSDILGQMVREDLSWSPVALAEQDLTTAVLDLVKPQIRSWTWLDPIKPALKKIAHSVLPSQAHLPI